MFPGTQGTYLQVRYGRFLCADKQDYKSDNKTMSSLLLRKKPSSFLGTDGLMPVNLPFFQ